MLLFVSSLYNYIPFVFLVMCTPSFLLLNAPRLSHDWHTTRWTRSTLFDSLFPSVYADLFYYDYVRSFACKFFHTYIVFYSYKSELATLSFCFFTCIHQLFVAAHCSSCASLVQVRKVLSHYIYYKKPRAVYELNTLVSQSLPYLHPAPVDLAVQVTWPSHTKNYKYNICINISLYYLEPILFHFAALDVPHIIHVYLFYKVQFTP